MRSAAENHELGACPHVARNDHRCGDRFSLGRLDQAFSVCLGAYHACPIYHRLNWENSRARERLHLATDDRPLRPTVTVTVNGRDLSLRPTGT